MNFLLLYDERENHRQGGVRNSSFPISTIIKKSMDVFIIQCFIHHLIKNVNFIKTKNLIAANINLCNCSLEMAYHCLTTISNIVRN